MGLLSFESKPEQPSTENSAVPTEKSTDEQTEGASPKIITSNALAEYGTDSSIDQSGALASIIKL